MLDLAFINKRLAEQEEEIAKLYEDRKEVMLLLEKHRDCMSDETKQKLDYKFGRIAVMLDSAKSQQQYFTELLKPLLK